MSGVIYDYEIREPGTAGEHDVVTANGIEFARITTVAPERMYVVHGLLGSLRGKRIARRSSHHDAYEAATVYAEKEGIGTDDGN